MTQPPPSTQQKKGTRKRNHLSQQIYNHRRPRKIHIQVRKTLLYRVPMLTRVFQHQTSLPWKGSTFSCPKSKDLGCRFSDPSTGNLVCLQAIHLRAGSVCPDSSLKTILPRAVGLSTQQVAPYGKYHAPSPHLIQQPQHVLRR